MRVYLETVRKKNSGSLCSDKGFALVATISVMVLLIMVALAMLSLSTITLRSDRHGSAMRGAQANARMALMIALGELQESMGPDQRISAPASILDGVETTPEMEGVENPHWMGVWNASPEGQSITYEDGRERSFRRWLVSLDEDSLFSHASTLRLDEQSGVSMGKASASGKRPFAGLVQVHGENRGKYAWIVKDHATKARINMPKDEAADIANVIARRAATTRHAPEVVTGASGLHTDEYVAKLVTPETAVIKEAGGVTGKHWRDALTSDSLSLITDVVKGGWKKDINTLMEMEDLAEFKRLGYGEWEGPGAFASKDAYLYGPGIALGARWNHLHTYYNLYKDVTFKAGVPQIEPAGKLIDWRLADRGHDFGDEAGGFSFPRIAKLIYTFSYSSEKEKAPDGKYKLKLVTDVFVTVWNPYNTRIVFPKDCCMLIKLSKGIPMRFKWFVNGSYKGEAPLHEIIPGKSLFIDTWMYNEKHGRLLAMEPGETTVFSTRLSEDGKQRAFYPGVRYDHDASKNVVLAGSLKGEAKDKISVSLEPDEHGAAYHLRGKRMSQYCDFWIFDTVKGKPNYEHRGEIISKWDAPFIQKMPGVDQEDVRSVTFDEVSGKKQPFGAFIIEIKTAQDSKNPSMAFLHSGISRLSSRIGDNNGEWNSERVEYKLEPLTSFNSDILQVTGPSHPAGANRGFIGSGRAFGTGVTHVMHAGIPLLPMTSLAQFQHAGIGDGAATLRATHWGFNSTPNHPYMDYAVGNSYAHPLVSKASKQTGNYYDHSYHANEVLWDHYFCSSIAPQTQSIFSPSREMKTVWKDFIVKQSPLLNTRYRLYRGGDTDEQLENIVFSGNALKSDAFKKVGSKLLFRGGFNVNSTSLEAWKAFLSSSYHDKVRHLEVVSTNIKAQTEQTQGTPFCRTSFPLASRIEGSSSTIQNRYLGYRDLTENDISNLAQKIVEEVKKRGPFLSMSDFVNRQLSSKSDLARSGALQAAIDASGVNDIVAADGVPTDGNSKGFAFPEAAKGNTAMGSPGWLMQGDLLTALGSSAFVRGDTFTIRAYGDIRDAQGEIVARAYCEAVVQRLPDYVDARDEATALPPVQNVNKRLGRKFKIVQFRWLKPSDLN